MRLHLELGRRGRRTALVSEACLALLIAGEESLGELHGNLLEFWEFTHGACKASILDMYCVLFCEYWCSMRPEAACYY
jgi:hypothetical protein